MKKIFYRLTQNQELRNNLPFFVNSYSSEFDQLFTVFNKGHIAHHIIYTLEGLGCIEIGGETFELKEGDFFFYRAGIPVKYYKKGETFITRYVSFGGFACEQLFEYYNIPKYILFKNNALFSSLTKFCSYADKSYSDEKIAGKLYSLIMDFCLTFNVNKTPKSLENALSYISRNFTRDIPISELSKAAGVSNSTLFKLFKDYMNTTPTAYIISSRIESAKLQLTSNPFLSIDVIANISGFSSTSYFIETFKKAEKTTPAKYRKEQLSKDF